MKVSVRVEGLDDFISSLDRSSRQMPVEAVAAGRAAGQAVLIPQIAASAPRRSGRLAGGYKIVSNGRRNEVVSGVPYGAGAEWGRRGKWSGFRGNYAGDALDRSAEALSRAIAEALTHLVTGFGWFR